MYGGAGSDHLIVPIGFVSVMFVGFSDQFVHVCTGSIGQSMVVNWQGLCASGEICV